MKPDRTAPERCGATTKAGTPCRAYAMQGSSLCAGHAGAGFGADPRAAARRSAQVRSEQAETRSEARNRGLSDLLAERLEQRADAIVDRLMRIIETGDDTNAIRALVEIMNRVYGRPKETVEHQVSRNEELRDLSHEERHQLYADLLRREQLELEAAASPPVGAFS